MVITASKIPSVLRTVCNRGVLARVSSDAIKFNGIFLDFDQHGLILDNRLMHLDDVRNLRHRDLTLFFPFRKTLLKGTVRLVGLTTFKGIRGLRFTLPERLVTDEKRGVKRIQHLPESTLTFHTTDLRIFHGRIHDASPSGFAVILNEHVTDDELYLKKGLLYQAEATLGQEIKLSFPIEIRHVSKLSKTGGIVGSYKVGVKILKLIARAQERLNEWLIQCNIRDVGSSGGVESIKANTTQPPPTAQRANSILVVGPESVDLDFWYQCLGRKYEVITSDDNIANIRDSLNTGPGLLLIHLDAYNPDKASFTRKFCSTLNNRFPIMFFGEESDHKKQQTLMGQVKNHGFLDTSERKLLWKFRHVDEVMANLK